MILQHPRYNAILKYKKACIKSGLANSEIIDRICANFKKRGLLFVRSQFSWYI